MAHTPGPWRVGKHYRAVVSDEPLVDMKPGTGHDDVASYGGYLIAESIWSDGDARLIAAAPELLEALRLCYEHCLLYHRDVERNNVGALVRAALAKATDVLPPTNGVTA